MFWASGCFGRGPASSGVSGKCSDNVSVMVGLSVDAGFLAPGRNHFAIALSRVLQKLQTLETMGAVFIFACSFSRFCERVLCPLG